MSTNDLLICITPALEFNIIIQIAKRVVVIIIDFSPNPKRTIKTGTSAVKGALINTFTQGSNNSSNSKRLVEVAKKAGCKNSQLINFEEEFPIKQIIKCDQIGLTSGASAPEKLVQEFIMEIKKHIKVSIKEISSTTENVTFKLPTM